MATRKQRDDEEKPNKPDPKEAPAPKADDDGVIEIELKGEEDAEEDDDGDEPEARPSRRERRNQRGFDEFRRRAEEAEARLAQVEQERQAQLAQQQQQHFAAQADEELNKLHEEKQALFLRFGEAERAGLTEAQREDWYKKARGLEERITVATWRKHGGGQQADPRAIAEYVELQQVQTRYADIYANNAARVWGEGRLRQLAAKAGGVRDKAHLYTLLEEAAEDTRREFGLAGGQRRPPPDAATKARTTGLPARASGNGGSAPATVIKMGPAERKMAKAMYPKMPEHLAYRTWASMRQKRTAQKER